MRAICSVMRPVFAKLTGTRVSPTGSSTGTTPFGLDRPSLEATGATPASGGTTTIEHTKAVGPASAVSTGLVGETRDGDARAVGKVALFEGAFEELVDRAGRPCHVAEELRGEQRRRHPETKPAAPQEVVELEGDLVGRADAARSGRRANDDRPRLGEETPDRLGELLGLWRRHRGGPGASKDPRPTTASFALRCPVATTRKSKRCSPLLVSTTLTPVSTCVKVRSGGRCRRSS